MKYSFGGSDSLDRVGSCVSGACAVHCALKPLLFVLPSVAGLELLMGATTERVLLGVGLFLALGSLSWGYSHHEKIEVFYPLVLGVLLLIAGRYGFSRPLRTILVVPGGLLLAGSHLVNMRLSHLSRNQEECTAPQ